MPHPRSSRAFTLVELLVSMVVLILLVVAVAAMSSGVSRTTVSNRRRLDNDDEARRVLDLMGNDFARMFKRADADSLFVPGSPTDLASGANGKFFFYSDAPAYYDATAQANATSADPRATAGLIGYRVNNNSSAANRSRWQLERLGKALTWDGSASAASGNGTSPGAVVFLTYPAASPSPAPTPPPDPNSTLAVNWQTTVGTAGGNYDDGTDSSYQVISPAVFRLDYCFVLKTAAGGSYFSRTHVQSQGFRDVSAVVVAVALLDADARHLLPLAAGQASPDLSRLVQALPEPNLAGAPPQLMAELWNQKIRGGTLASDASMPQAVVSQVRVYQRYFYLNTPN